MSDVWGEELCGGARGILCSLLCDLQEDLRNKSTVEGVVVVVRWKVEDGGEEGLRPK